MVKTTIYLFFKYLIKIGILFSIYILKNYPYIPKTVFFFIKKIDSTGLILDQYQTKSFFFVWTQISS